MNSGTQWHQAVRRPAGELLKRTAAQIPGGPGQEGQYNVQQISAAGDKFRKSDRRLKVSERNFFQSRLPMASIRGYRPVKATADFDESMSNVQPSVGPR